MMVLSDHALWGMFQHMGTVGHCKGGAAAAAKYFLFLNSCRKKNMGGAGLKTWDSGI